MTKHISWAKFALCVTVFLPNCIFAANGNQPELTLEDIRSLIARKTPGELVSQLDLALSEFNNYIDEEQNRRRIWEAIAINKDPIRESARTLVMAMDLEIELQQQRKRELSRIIAALDQYGVQPTPGPVRPFA